MGTGEVSFKGVCVADEFLVGLVDLVGGGEDGAMHRAMFFRGVGNNVVNLVEVRSVLESLSGSSSVLTIGGATVRGRGVSITMC